MKFWEKLKKDWNFNFSDSQINAEEAFSRSLTQNNLTEEELRNSIIREIDRSIKTKVIGGNMSLSVDITSRNRIYLEGIKSHYEELGYTVVIINSKIVPQLGPDEGYIWFSWNKNINK